MTWEIIVYIWQEKKRAAAAQQAERDRKKLLQEEKKKQLQEIIVYIGHMTCILLLICMYPPPHMWEAGKREANILKSTLHRKLLFTWEIVSYQGGGRHSQKYST